jgi:N-acetylneuraminic acid mutarotase
MPKRIGASLKFAGRSLALIGFLWGGMLTAQVMVDVSPATITLTTGTTKTFTATVSGTNNTSVIWSVRDLGGGSINSKSGFYTAPSTPGIYHVRATSKTGTSNYGESTVSVVAPPNATISAATSVTAGQIGLSASVENVSGSTFSWTISGGVLTSPAASSGVTYTAGSGASLTLYCTVKNAAGASASSSKIESIVAAPIISSFSSNKTTVTVGNVVLLTPIFSNGTGSISPVVGAVSSGSVSSVTVSSNTTYTLTVTNSLGATTTSYLTVNAVAAPVISSFTAAKSLVTVGAGTSLTAVFANGTASISGLGEVASGLPISTGNLATYTTYTLTITNAAGDCVTRQVTVNVVAAPTISSFSAAKTTLSSGSSTTLSASFSGGVATIDMNLGSIATGSSVSTGALAASTTFTLTVTNAASDSVSQQVSVNVVAVPRIAAFAAAKSPLTTGKATALTATFSGGNGGIDNGIGSVSTGVSVPTAYLTAVTTYTLTVTNAAGDSVSQQVSVDVVAAPTIMAFTAAKSPVTTGKAGSLVATFSNGSAIVDNGIGAVTSGMAVPTSLLTASTTYTLTVTNAAGDSVSQTTPIEVVAAPVVTSFSAAKSPITVGEGTSLTATFTGGTGAINNGIGPVVSGASVPTTLITADTTYTLTITNTAGDSAIQTLTVATVAVPTISAFTASPVAILPGGTSTLSWNTIGANSLSIDQGIGDVTTTPSIQVSPNATTTYTLSAANQAGAIATAQVSVHTLITPVVTLDSYVTTGKPALTAYTPDQGQDVTYVWTLTNGTIQAGQGTRTIIYSAGTPGTLTASVKVGVQSAEATGTATATVVPAPIADLFAQSQVFYDTDGIQASTPSQTGMTYLWILTNGTATGMFTNGANSNVVTYGTGPTVGNYQLTVNVQNQAGDFASATRTLNVVNNQFLKDVHTSIQREGHTATTLPSGRILVAGGSGSRTYSAELFDPATGTWSKAGDMTSIRQFHSATLLSNGKVLVAGGIDNATAETYDPSTDSWTIVRPMATARKHHAAVLLNNGKVLVMEGSNSTTSSLSNAELFDPTTSTWSSAGTLAGPRDRPKATLLGNGNVLVSGSWSNWAELYNPTTNVWSRAANMLAPYRSNPTLTLLTNGRVLVAGGGDTPKPTVNAEVYDPSTNTWSATGNMVSYYTWRNATLLQDGKVLVVGGLVSTNEVSGNAESYDPSTNAWTAVGGLALGRIQFTVNQLENGNALVVGGGTGGVTAPFANAEVFDPAVASWSSAGSMAGHGSSNTATLLTDGKVLVVGVGPDYKVETFDGATSTWSSAGALTVLRTGFTSTLLPGGSVLVAGGNVVKPANELFNPSTSLWGSAGNLLTARNYQTATLLGNGKVLIAGGQYYSNSYYGPLASTELFDPATNTCTSASNMASTRYRHAAVSLGNGKVLVAGGYSYGALSSAEIYNPLSNTWSSAGSMSVARDQSSATALLTGKVLVVGGSSATADLYDPTTNTWSAAGSMLASRNNISTLLLLDGKVFAASNGSAEVYDPTTKTWSSGGLLTSNRSGQSAVLLGNGSVLIVGGYPGYIPEFWKK